MPCCSMISLRGRETVFHFTTAITPIPVNATPMTPAMIPPTGSPPAKAETEPNRARMPRTPATEPPARTLRVALLPMSTTTGGGGPQAVMAAGYR